MTMVHWIRNAVTACAAALVLAACAVHGGASTSIAPGGDARPPILFVHGNGDGAALWVTTAWRFESNGWPADRLFAMNLPNPLARQSEEVAQPGRSSAAEFTSALALEVERIRKLTGAAKVVLIGNSRGGYPIRRYVRDTAGATVSAVVLGGVPNHGVWEGDFNPGSEFNGRGAWLKSLNEPQGPDGLEVTPGVRFLTLRSDGNDKYAQPNGAAFGAPTLQTNIGPDAPALKGALNVVLPGVDHRETSFGLPAFREAFRFLTGAYPLHDAIVPQAQVVLDGHINALNGTEATNLPLAGAQLEIFEVAAASGERQGSAVHQRTVGADGLWGTFTGKPDAYYEFVIHADGYAITHTYRSPFPRSSAWINMSPVRLAEADRDALSIVTMTRPRGYFGPGRDRMSLDGKHVLGIPPGVASVSSTKDKVYDIVGAARTVVAEFDSERIAVRTWPVRENHAVIAEFLY